MIFETILSEKVMSIPNALKYVIIGAGIHGLSTAYHLALDLYSVSASPLSV